VANYDLSGTPGLTAQIPIFPAVSASALTDGTDISSNTAFNTTKVDVTCAEIGAMIKLTDLGRESAAQDVAVAIGRQLGDAMAKKVDTDLAALFTGFSQSVGTGNTELTADLFFKAGALLRNAQAPGPLVAVIHPYQGYQLRKVLTNAGANVINHNLSDVGNEALRSGFITTINGISIFESTVVTGASDGAFVGAVMSSQALAYVLKRSMRIEEQRDASLRSTEYVGSMAYGVSELIDLYGVKLIADARVTN
jgi:N4-gp56 family major capsid protein